MNIKQQLEQVIGNFRDIAADLASIGRTAFSNAVSRETANLSAIVEQMEADEQAIVDEVNKRWPTGKPQPDDTFVGAAPQVKAIRRDCAQSRSRDAARALDGTGGGEYPRRI